MAVRGDTAHRTANKKVFLDLPCHCRQHCRRLVGAALQVLTRSAVGGRLIILQVWCSPQRLKQNGRQTFRKVSSHVPAAEMRPIMGDERLQNRDEKRAIVQTGARSCFESRQNFVIGTATKGLPHIHTIARLGLGNRQSECQSCTGGSVQAMSLIDVMARIRGLGKRMWEEKMR